MNRSVAVWLLMVSSLASIGAADDRVEQVVLALHGGAGVLSKELTTPGRAKESREVLESALRRACETPGPRWRQPGCGCRRHSGAGGLAAVQCGQGGGFHSRGPQRVGRSHHGRPYSPRGCRGRGDHRKKPHRRCADGDGKVAPRPADRPGS